MSFGRVLLPQMSDEEIEELNQFLARANTAASHDSEGLYIVLAALSGIAFMLAAAILTYLLHFIFSTLYRIVVIEQRCSCGRSNETMEDVPSRVYYDSVVKPLDLRPPSYQQVTQQGLPSYEDLMRDKNVQST